MRRRSKILILIVILLLLGGIAWVALSRPAQEPEKTYSISNVTRGNIVSTVSATGTLSPVITVQVGSQVSGTIARLYADFNSHVKKDQLIAQIDPALFKARLAEAQANLKSAEASREKARITALDAKRQWERLQKQQSQKLVSESDVDSARFAYEAAVVEQQIKAAAAEQAKAARDREKVNLEYTSIFAPIDGVVISRNVDVGQTVAASLQAPTLFTIAQDLTRMQIETEVDEAFIGAIGADQPVRFTVFAYQKRQFEGRVAQVRLNPTIEAGVVKYNCIIHVDNSDLALKPGMTATVTIEVDRNNDVLKVPNTALRFVPDWPADRLKALSADMQPNEGLIWRPEGDDIQPVKVTLGAAGEKETEVSGNGVTEGMPIAVPDGRKNEQGRRRFGLSLF